MRGLELFSGSAVLSRRFREGGWEMDTVDINDGQNVLAWFPTPSRPYDFVWAAPPCQQYSFMGARTRKPWDADRTLWLRSLYLIAECRPRYWCIENVKGAQWVWGRAPYRYGPFFVWGYFPVPADKGDWRKSYKGTHNFNRTGGPRFNESRTAAERAVYPREMLDTIFAAIDGGFRRGYQLNGL